MMFLKRTAAAILGGAILCSGATFAANVNTSHGGARPDTGVSFLAQKRTGGVRFFFIYFLRLRLILLC